MGQADRGDRVWQRALFTMCAFALLFALFSIFLSYTWVPKLGTAFVSTPSAVPFQQTVIRVDPNGPAAKAGLKVGDVVDLHRASPADRYAWFAPDQVAGRKYGLTFYDGKRARTLTAVAKCCIGFDLSSWGWFAGALGAVVFATLLAWRRAHLSEARVLCALLTVSVLAVTVSPGNWVTPSVRLDFSAALVSFLLVNAGTALIVVYTLLFGRPVSVTRRIVTIAALSVLVLGVLYQWCAYIGFWTGAFDLFTSSGLVKTVNEAYSTLAAFLPLVCITLAFIAARGRERSLLAWTAAMSFLGLADGLVGVAPIYVPALYGNTALGDVVRDVGNGSVFLTPFFVGYALLNRRIMDIGFALNRAIVFSVVSLVTVAAFVLVEWALSEWLSSKNHSTNLLVGAGLALVLGLSVRFIHQHVDNAVDRALFFKRRRDQDALNAFSREAAYVTDREVLLERTRDVLLQHADASAVTILLDDRQGHYGSITENDPAIVTLRASHSPLDLHTVRSDVDGDYAFPMVSRGRVLGALILGAKRSGEAYAPDDREIILRLAHSVAAAVDVLSYETATDPALEKLDAVYTALLSLPQAIRDANREFLTDVLRTQ